MFHSLRIRIFVPGLALCFLFPILAAAQGGSAPGTTSAGIKIGVVNMQEAIFTTDEGKKESAGLQQRFGTRQNTLKTQKDQVEKLTSQLQVLGDKLGDEERTKRVKEISEKQKTLQSTMEKFQADVEQAEQGITDRLGVKMMQVLEKYADNNGYGIILDVSNPQTPVLWAGKGLNLTNALVDAYNAENPVSVAPVAKPAAPATPKKP